MIKKDDLKSDAFLKMKIIKKKFCMLLVLAPPLHEPLCVCVRLCACPNCPHDTPFLQCRSYLDTDLPHPKEKFDFMGEIFERKCLSARPKKQNITKSTL